MGVPQFFHWLVTHYENELLSDNFPHANKRPNILYLDFNCAIHPAVKSGDYATLDDMYVAVCNYLQKIISEIYKISPTPSSKMTVYIAVDGVAPMGKMKQQRYRRYKAVKDRAELDSIDRKHQRYTVAKHDFNMISPGTEFMNGLTTALNTFIQTTLKEKYPDISVILDDASNPGEGEHKIMHHIRTKTSPDDNVMVYGLDSDLIFLTLLHYRPYLCLFREKIHFSNKFSKDKDNDDNKFTFLNLTTFRKIILAVMDQKMTKSKLNEWGILKPYQERVSEFKQELFDIDSFNIPTISNSPYKPIPVCDPTTPIPVCDTSTPISYQSKSKIVNQSSNQSKPIMTSSRSKVQDEMRKQDLEYIDQLDDANPNNKDYYDRLIIDYMMICIFLGNDFLPHIPSLKIKDGGLERVINSYKITQARLPNQTLIIKQPTTNSTTNRTNSTNGINEKFLLEFLHTLSDYEDVDLTLQVEAMQVRLKKWKFRLNGITDPYEKDLTRWEYVEDQWQDKIQYSMSNWKSRYYNHYINTILPEESDRMIENYLTGLVWNLQYYLGNDASEQMIDTCPDWLWKYNYLVAPPVSDIYRYLQINLNKGFLETSNIEWRGPVTTDVQLLLILPPQSVKLLKPEYQCLMTNPDSPIIFQYPTDFKINLQGQRFRWECYPILPPIDPHLTSISLRFL
jgi:5'-3' exonuclease